MKCRILILLVVSLAACTPTQQGAGVTGKTPHFYNASADDPTMTRDLNECARQSFKTAMQNDGLDQTVLKKECMRSKGYEIYYN